MKAGIASDTAKSAKNIAQVIARQMAQEPLEVLKTASAQVTGAEKAPEAPINKVESQNDASNKIAAHQAELGDKIKSSRQLEAYTRELEDMHKQSLFKDLQAKISEGNEIPLEDYPELSMEQREVLRAQMEAYKFQKKQAEYNAQASALPMPASKPGRRGPGQKQEAEKQQTRVEKPVPPSG